MNRGTEIRILLVLKKLDGMCDLKGQIRRNCINLLEILIVSRVEVNCVDQNNGAKTGTNR